MDETKGNPKSSTDVIANVEDGTINNLVSVDLHRRLKSRHIQFMALGGTIGTGLFLGIGGGLADSGPLSLLLGYSLQGLAVFAMMMCLGEMTTWLPLPGAIGQLMARFVDESLGFAIGWNQWYNVSIGQCAEISAAVALVNYWDDSISPAAWITIILVVIVLINIGPVQIYGETEFWFACIKVLTLLGLIFLGLVLMLGGGPDHDRLGFRYWKSPGAMRSYIAAGAAGRFLGVYHILSNAAFAYGGIEQLAIAAGETKNPTQSIPKAIRRVFWRILIFYVLGAFMVGILVPYNNPNLLTGSGIAASPWVIAIQNASIPVLPSLINAVIITSASSAANAQLYSGSRYLYALAAHGQAPKIFLKTTKHGVPLLAVAATGSVALITYITVSSTGAQVFQWFSNLVSIAYLITWTAICFAYTRFRKAMDYHKIPISDQHFVAPFRQYIAWSGFVFFSIVIFFNGFAVFTKGHWDIRTFITSYIGLPIVVGLYLGWKLFTKDKLIPISEIDLQTGRTPTKSEYDVEEHPEKKRSCLQKAWDWAV